MLTFPSLISPPQLGAILTQVKSTAVEARLRPALVLQYDTPQVSIAWHGVAWHGMRWHVLQYDTLESVMRI